MRRVNFFFLILSQSLILINPGNDQTRKENLIYFPNTPYQLNLYVIYGKERGKTLMLIGGTQGNGVGGFLSADLYTGMSLLRGNLFVVPTQGVLVRS